MLNAFWPSFFFAMFILFVSFAFDLFLLLLPSPPDDALIDVIKNNAPLRETITKTMIKFFGGLWTH